MIDVAMQDFVQTDLEGVEELTHRYQEYRQSISEAYLLELRSKIECGVPEHYKFISWGEAGFRKLEEKLIGWEYKAVWQGQSFTYNIGFGVWFKDKDPIKALTWPFMNKRCYVGIVVNGLAAPIREELRKTALRHFGTLFGQSGPSEASWLLWRYWETLSDVSARGLHDRLISAERAADQNEIVEAMHQWRIGFEKVLHDTNAEV